MTLANQDQFKPEGNGSGSTSGDDQNKNQNQNQDQGTRPEYIQEQFWDAEAKSVRVESLAKAFNDTKAKLSQERDKLKAEIEESLKTARPEIAQNYKLNMPSDMKIPDGVDFKVEDSDPLMQQFKSWAHGVNLSQEQFDSAMGMYLKAQLRGIPDPDKEKEQLGDQADSRIQNVVAFANKHLTEDDRQAFFDATKTARGIKMLERLIEVQKQGGPGDFNKAEPTTTSLQEEFDKIISEGEYKTNPRINERLNYVAQKLRERKDRA